jgi:hypothetical protein
MVTEEQYQDAVKQNESSEKIINEYHKQKRDAFDLRMKNNSIFTDDELRYSAYNLCPCGHGLAYPKDCGPDHYWDCSAILKGIADKNVEHCPQLPFTMSKIKSEDNTLPGGKKMTTRGVFNPKTDSGK